MKNLLSLSAKHRKKKIIAIVAGGMAATSVGAFAYFTATGSGTGTAPVGTSTPFTITAPLAANLYPGGVAVSIPLTITNNGSGAQYINKVHLQSITPDGTHAACVVTVSGAGNAFTFADVTVAATVAKSATTTATGSLTMNDTGISQDNCQGATLTLNFTSN